MNAKIARKSEIKINIFAVLACGYVLVVMMKVVDTFHDFMIYWSQASSKNLNQQIELWQTSYMAKYPELLEKQMRNYEEEGVDWKVVAKEHVFMKLKEHFPLMQEARENLLTVCETVYEKAKRTLKLDFDVVFVVYVGIGCGAGWATQYEEQPACLLGLENIAECRWHTRGRLQGLLAHEIGHLAHMTWRNEWTLFERAEQDPLFQLYSEGFAQRCEHMILEQETWHQAKNKSWVSWCRLNKDRLAQEFLKRTEKGESVRDFFGSWFDIEGKKNTGYFLGHEFIRDLENAYALKEFALFKIEEVRKLALSYLKSVRN